MVNVRMELILLGDGMSGKTSILIKIAELVLEQAFEEYQVMLLRHDIPTFDDWRSRIKPYLNIQDLHRIIERRPVLKHMLQAEYLAWLELEEPIVISFENWLRREGIFVEDILSKDTSLATLGLETFEMRFPLGRHHLFVNGYDLGGQNIYDHLRNVLAGLAKPDSYLLIVFDSSRYISCENSIYQLEDSIKKLGKRGKGVPTIIAILNKIDLHRHLNDPKRQENYSQWIYDTLSAVKTKGATYEIPHVLRSDEMIQFTIPPTNELGFEHVESLIHYSLRTNDKTFGKPPLTELNARALARELTSHLLLLQQPEETFEPYFTQLKHVIFEERPLALQHVGGFKLKVSQEQDSQEKILQHVRKKFEPFVLNLDDLNLEIVREAIKRSIKTELLEKDLKIFSKRIFKTNAIGGEGIIDVFAYLAYLETTKSERLSKTPSETKRSLRRL